MSLKSVFVLAILCFGIGLVNSECQNNIIAGELTTNDGQGPTYILGSPKVVHVSGNQLTLDYSSGGSFAKVCQNNWSPTIFKDYKLLDKTISFTADVSTVGCGCNAAFYLTSSPAYGQNQQPDPTRCGDYYCDANNVCGSFCPEIDLFEANNRALQVTPHTCDSPQGKYFAHCDGAGCGQNTHRNDPNSYGLGSNFIINTQYPFRVSTSFRSTNGLLTSVTTVLSQNSRSFTMVHNSTKCGSNYLPNLTNALNNGMVVTASHWSGETGETMAWLDVPPCDRNEACSRNGRVTFSDVVVN